MTHTQRNEELSAMSGEASQCAGEADLKASSSGGASLILGAMIACVTLGSSAVLLAPLIAGRTSHGRAATAAQDGREVLVVQGGRVNVRAAPSEKSDVVARVTVGTECRAATTDRGADFRHVQCGAYTGYVKAALLGLASPSYADALRDAKEKQRPTGDRFSAALKAALLAPGTDDWHEPLLDAYFEKLRADLVSIRKAKKAGARASPLVSCGEDSMCRGWQEEALRPLGFAADLTREWPAGERPANTEGLTPYEVSDFVAVKVVGDRVSFALGEVRNSWDEGLQVVIQFERSDVAETPEVLAALRASSREQLRPYTVVAAR